MNVDFEWHDDYSVGVEEIDAQHKRFLQLIKATYDLEDKSIERSEVLNLLNELVLYALFHFNSEEMLMKTYLYPKYLEQKNQHVHLITTLQKKIDELKAHQGDLIVLLHFLMRWFVDHDSCFDQEFGAHVNKMRKINNGVHKHGDHSNREGS